MRKIFTVLLVLALMSFTNEYITSKASYYADAHHGKKTASGEVFNQYEFTAAHKTLSFGSKVEVINLANDKRVIVKINDRGPFIKGRDLDLSKRAFEEISSLKTGVIKVSYRIL